jgi:hypothetical protein
MTRVWLDWLVKVALVTAAFALLALVAGWDQAVAGRFDADAAAWASSSASMAPAAGFPVVGHGAFMPVLETRLAADGYSSAGPGE